MANRLLPFRQYDENDVINLFANDASDAKSTTDSNGSAGVFVSIKSGGGNFSKDPITYIDRAELSASYSHTKNQYPEVQLKVAAAVGAAKAGEVIGLTVKQTLETDENGEKLLYNPRKAAEMGVVIPGQAIPIASRGVFLYRSSDSDWTGSTIAPNTPLYGAANGVIHDASGSSAVRVGTALGLEGAVDSGGYVAALIKIELG